MPENLTGWKIRVWAMGHGTKVGQGEVEVVTKKNLIVRLQAPRFFVAEGRGGPVGQRPQLPQDRQSRSQSSLELEGGTLDAHRRSRTQTVSIPAGGEKRVDWRVKVKAEGEAVVRMKAITDEESDAMQMRFPCYVHGMLKMDSFSGVIRPDKDSGAHRRSRARRAPHQRDPAGSALFADAGRGHGRCLPYLVDYPYGCTEQTLNRFLPTVITQRILQNMNWISRTSRRNAPTSTPRRSATTRSAPRAGNAIQRNPVFDEAEVRRMVRGRRAGAGRTCSCSDGGWGWFSGWGEQSWPHTTAVVVHGLQIAKANDVALPPGMLERGVAWLKSYQAEQVQLHPELPRPRRRPYKETPTTSMPWSTWSWSSRRLPTTSMRDFLYRDRDAPGRLRQGDVRPGPAQAAAGRQAGHDPEEHRAVRGEDNENQTAYLQAAGRAILVVLVRQRDRGQRLLSQAAVSAPTPRTTKAAGLVKYLLNNRKHATYWNSTRDTAMCIEAMADYLKASGEDKPDMTVEVWLDGKKHKEVKIDASNLFTFDNKLVLTGDAVDTGKHTLEIQQEGHRPGLLQRLPDQLHPGGLHHQGGPGGEGQPQVLQADAAWTRTIKVSGARGQAARSEGREVRAHRAGEPGRAQERRPGRGRAGDRQQERLRVSAVRGPEGGRLRAGAGPQRLQRQRPGRLHGAARRQGVLLRAHAGARQAQRSATGCVPRSPASSAPCRRGRPPCMPRS